MPSTGVVYSSARTSRRPTPTPEAPAISITTPTQNFRLALARGIAPLRFGRQKCLQDKCSTAPAPLRGVCPPALR
jgi:hypothetical protein